MRCANCSSDALYEYRITQEKSVLYCGKHLPKFLDARRRAGNLAITPKFEEAKKDLEDLGVVAKPAVIEEPVEAVAAEEVVAPKPKRKPKKAAVKDADNS